MLCTALLPLFLGDVNLRVCASITLLLITRQQLPGALLEPAVLAGEGPQGSTSGTCDDQCATSQLLMRRVIKVKSCCRALRSSGQAMFLQPNSRVQLCGRAPLHGSNSLLPDGANQ